MPNRFPDPRIDPPEPPEIADDDYMYYGLDDDGVCAAYLRSTLSIDESVEMDECEAYDIVDTLVHSDKHRKNRFIRFVARNYEDDVVEYLKERMREG